MRRVTETAIDGVDDEEEEEQLPEPPRPVHPIVSFGFGGKLVVMFPSILQQKLPEGSSESSSDSDFVHVDVDNSVIGGRSSVVSRRRSLVGNATRMLGENGPVHLYSLGQLLADQYHFSALRNGFPGALNLNCVLFCFLNFVSLMEVHFATIQIYPETMLFNLLKVLPVNVVKWRLEMFSR